MPAVVIQTEARYLTRAFRWTDPWGTYPWAVFVHPVGSVRRRPGVAMQAHIGTYNNMPALHSPAQTYARTMAPERPTRPFSRPAPSRTHQTPFERPAPQRPPYRTYPRTRPPAREN